MKEISIERIGSISSSSKTEVDDNGICHLVTKLTLKAEIPPEELARIHELSLKGVSMFATIGTKQMSFGVLDSVTFKSVDSVTGEIKD